MASILANWDPRKEHSDIIRTTDSRRMLSPRVSYKVLCWPPYYEMSCTYNDLHNIPVTEEATIVDNANEKAVIVSVRYQTDIFMIYI